MNGNVKIIFLLSGYICAGAILFSCIEMEKPQNLDSDNDEKFLLYKLECLQELWNITESLNLLYERNWTRMVDEPLRKFQWKILLAERREVINKVISETFGTRWSFTASLFYSFSLVTTTGSEVLSPTTSTGKMVATIYAVIGIPITFLSISYLGENFARYFKFAPSSKIITMGSNPNICKIPKIDNSRNEKERRNDFKEIMVVASCGNSASHSKLPNKFRTVVLNSRHLARGQSSFPGDNGHIISKDDRATRCDLYPGYDSTPSKVPLVATTTEEDHFKDETGLLHVTSAALFFFGYLCVGTTIFSIWKGTDILRGAYMCFLSAVTIQTDEYSILHKAEGRLIAHCAFVIFALLLLAVLYFTIQETIANSNKYNMANKVYQLLYSN